MNETPKVVFSRTLERADWAQSRIARGELAEEIAELKRAPGKDMLAWGGSALAGSLSRLELVDAQTYATGAALHIYRPAPAAA